MVRKVCYFVVFLFVSICITSFAEPSYTVLAPGSTDARYVFEYSDEVWYYINVPDYSSYWPGGCTISGDVDWYHEGQHEGYAYLNQMGQNWKYIGSGLEAGNWTIYTVVDYYHAEQYKRDYFTATASFYINPVPEVSTVVFWAAGFAGLILLKRKSLFQG
ncbi:hypothetical protein M0R36_05890 [bacterium]|jgi:hypothetical protein|nr:hypothetical protein [bacterium]